MSKVQELEKQIQQLQSEIERLKEIEKNGNQWKPSLGEVYWVISDDEQIWLDCWEDYQIDNDRLLMGNIFKTKEEARFELERRKSN